MVVRADVRAFYDEFLESRMVQYRLFGNRRIELAARRIEPYIHRDHRVLDVGCGIGIVTERIAARARRGRVWGIDLSPRNVWYAAHTVRKSNVSFFTADVLGEGEQIRAQTGGAFDVITMVDVIEHIPEADRPALFASLRALSAPNAMLVLTYPSPQYQRWLQANRPQELQIIDNVVELPALLDETGAAGYGLRHYSLEDVWMRNQYAHCVLQTDEAVATPARAERSLGQEIGQRVQRATRNAFLVPWRRWRFVTRVLNEEQRESPRAVDP
ncbi:MAG TPA: class I SAM-dependent methyltransferase [Gemmatimonadaceae bacterium]|jgi:SAM-dependent methyltransferase